MKFADTMDMNIISEEVVEQLYRAVCSYCSDRKEEFSAEGWLMTAQDGRAKAFSSPEEGAPLSCGADLSAIVSELAGRLKDTAFEEVSLRVCSPGRKTGEMQTLFSGEGSIYFRLLW